MPTTVSVLFQAADLPLKGPLEWGRVVHTAKPGVYVISTSSDPRSHMGILPRAPVSTKLVAEWIKKAPAMTLDKKPIFSAGAIVRRLNGFWIPSESVLYIGMTTRPLTERVSEYYRSQLGAKSPHSGGFWIKALSNTNELFVYYAPCENPGGTETKLLEIFVDNVDPTDKQNLKDPSRPFPYANLKGPYGKIKRHGIKDCRW